MYGSLFWIEWLDRLDRILTSTVSDLATLSRVVSPRGLAAVEQSTRQLTSLTHDLELLDRRVWVSRINAHETDQAAGLKQAPESTLLRLGHLTAIEADGDPETCERMIAAAAESLRDSRYEAEILLEPQRRRA